MPWHDCCLWRRGSSLSVLFLFALNSFSISARILLRLRADGDREMLLLVALWAFIPNIDMMKWAKKSRCHLIYIRFTFVPSLLSTKHITHAHFKLFYVAFQYRYIRMQVYWYQVTLCVYSLHHTTTTIRVSDISHWKTLFAEFFYHSCWR